jgi:hypothetical protein
MEGLKAALETTKQVIALSTGVVALTVTFLEKIVQPVPGVAREVPGTLQVGCMDAVGDYWEHERRRSKGQGDAAERGPATGCCVACGGGKYPSARPRHAPDVRDCHLSHDCERLLAVESGTFRQN